MRAPTGAIVASIIAFVCLGGCNQTTQPSENIAAELLIAADPVASSSTGISHLMIASLETHLLANINDPEAIADALAPLTEAEISVLATRRIVAVVDPEVVSAIALVAGLADPAMIEDGILLTTYVDATWGVIKCCFKDPNCCPKPEDKKEK
jgi:hypothetical protein